MTHRVCYLLVLICLLSVGGICLSITHSTVTSIPNNPAKDVSATAWNAAHTVGTGSITYDALSGTLHGATAYVGFDSTKDGLTNYWYCDGAADDVQLQAAIDYVEALGGGSVYLESGIYDITAALSLVGAGQSQMVKLMGSSKENAVLKLSATDNIMELSNAAWVHLESLYFNLNGQDGHGLYGSDAGVSEMSTYHSAFKHLYFEGVNPAYYGIYLINPQYSYFEDLHISTSGHGLRLENDSASTNYGNCHINYIFVQMFEGSAFGIDLYSSGATNIINLNHFTNVQINAVNTKVNRTGIRLYQSAWNTFTHLCIEGCETAGILLDSAGGALRTRGNLFQGGYADAVGYFIHTGASATRQNTVKDMLIYGLDVAAVMIYEEAAVDYEPNLYENVVADGTWHANFIQKQTASICRGTTGTTGSPPTVSENRGAATILNGAASVVVTHGLYTTPGMIHVTGTHTEVDLLYVTAVGAATFTITAADGNTSGDRTVYWRAEVV